LNLNLTESLVTCKVYFMIEKSSGRGLAGISRSFKEAVLAHGKGGRLLFVGSPFTCLPFAEFLAYSIRKIPYAIYFAPDGYPEKISRIEGREGFGFSLGELSDDRGFDVVVLLGGLAMEKSWVDPVALKSRLVEVCNLGFIVGFCFQGVMNRPEWFEVFKFKYFIDADISRVILLEGNL
jgi:hypothetical protein